MSKLKLAILSDIFGASNEDWIRRYELRLSPFFQITHFDSRELAGISHLDQREIHSAFVNGGIETASDRLYSDRNDFDAIIGFSVGGTIAWKYGCKNANARLYLISATRIRNEVEKPTNPMELYFGELESNGPSEEWFSKFQLDPIAIENFGHDCYKEEHVIDRICKNVLNNF